MKTLGKKTEFIKTNNEWEAEPSELVMTYHTDFYQYHDLMRRTNPSQAVTPKRFINEASWLI